MSTESGPRDEARELRNRLVEELVRQGAITSQQVQQAFEEVPRRLFVPRVNIATAYSDEPIFIRWEDGVPISSSSQPKMMALMMEQLGVEPGSRVLEIGAAPATTRPSWPTSSAKKAVLSLSTSTRTSSMRLPRTCPRPATATSR